MLGYTCSIQVHDILDMICHLLWINVIQMILHKLNTGCEVSLIELIWYVPAKGTKLSPLLHSGVEECHGVQHGPPLVQCGDVQLLLCNASIGSL